MSDYSTKTEYDDRLEMYADVVEDEYDGDIYRTIDHTLDGMIRNYREALHILMHSETQPDEWDIYASSEQLADSLEGHLIDLAYLTLRADLKAELRDRDTEFEL